MSTLLNSVAPVPQYVPNPASAVLGEAANATHELSRFRSEVAELKRLRLDLGQVDSKATIAGRLVNEVESHADEIGRFYQEVFRETPDDGAVAAPLALTAGRFRLAVNRLSRSARATGATNAIDAAVSNYVEAWQESMAIEGLGNWPVLLRELRRQRENGSGFNQYPGLDRSVSIVETAMKDRIVAVLHGEMLAMAAYQSPMLATVAQEFIARDIRPALQRVFGLETSPNAGADAPVEPMAIEQAQIVIDGVLNDLEAVDAAGAQWVKECEETAELLQDKSAPLSVRIKIDGRHPENDARPAVVVVVPHADDEASKLGALMAKLSSEGNRVVLVVLTDNSAGAPQTESTDIPSVHRNFGIQRDLEMIASAQILGVSEVVMMRYGDSGMRSSPSAHARRLAAECDDTVVTTLFETVKGYGASVLLTIQDAEEQWPYDHDDHQVTEKCTRRVADLLRQNPVNGVIPTYYVATLSEGPLVQYYEALGLPELIGPMRPAASTATACIALDIADIQSERHAMAAYPSQVSSEPNAFWTWVHGPCAELKRVHPAIGADEQAESALMMGERVAQKTPIIEAIPTTLDSDGPQAGRRERLEVGLTS